MRRQIICQSLLCYNASRKRNTEGVITSLVGLEDGRWLGSIWVTLEALADLSFPLLHLLDSVSISRGSLPTFVWSDTMAMFGVVRDPWFDIAFPHTDPTARKKIRLSDKV